MNDPQKKCRLGTVSKSILLEGLNRFHGANLTLSLYRMGIRACALDYNCMSCVHADTFAINSDSDESDTMTKDIEP